ncbi:hypothetical protein QTP88_029692 [Uroleucon formosanum]
MLNVDRLRNPLEIAQYRKRISEELCITNEKVENIIPNHETNWTNIKNAITSAAKNLKEKPNHNKKKHWFNKECMETNDLLLEQREIVQHFRKHFDTLLNTNQANNSNRTKYEELIYQTAEPECKEPDLTEIDQVDIETANGSKKAPTQMS